MNGRASALLEYNDTTQNQLLVKDLAGGLTLFLGGHIISEIELVPLASYRIALFNLQGGMTQADSFSF